MVRSVFPLATVVFLSTSAYIGCSSEETDPPRERTDSGVAATTDAGGTTPDTGTSTPKDSGSTPPTDSGGTPPTDSGTASACTAYCTCMGATCAGKLSDCASQCAAGSTWDLSCRTTHCNLAKNGDTPLHCGHAAGESTCP